MSRSMTTKIHFCLYLLNSEELEVQIQWHIEMIRYAKLPAMNDLEKFKVIHEALIEICTLWALSSLQMKFMAEV